METSMAILTGYADRLRGTLAPTMEQRLARCKTPLSKFQLFQALTGNTTSASTISINGVAVILSSIQRESGSGSSFILTVCGPDGESTAVYRSYVHTID